MSLDHPLLTRFEALLTHGVALALRLHLLGNLGLVGRVARARLAASPPEVLLGVVVAHGFGRHKLAYEPWEPAM